MLIVSPSARRAIGTLPLLLAGLANLPQFILPQFILLQFILPAFIAPAAAHEKVPTYRVVYVAPGDVLNLRAGPSAAYSVVGAIPPGSGDWPR